MSSTTSTTPSQQDATTSNGNNSNTKPEMVCKLQMWLGRSTDLPNVLQSLQDPSVQFLDLYIRESFLATFPPSLLRVVMQAIGDMMNLERLDISMPNDSYNNNIFLPITAIHTALSRARKLTHLLLVNLKLGGTPSDFDALAHVMKQLPRLYCVVFSEVQLQHPSQSTTIIMERMLQTFAQMPRLQHLLVSGKGDQCLGSIQPSTLQSIITTDTMRDFCLSHLSLTTPHLQVITHHQLQELDLQCHVTVQGAKALATMLQHNTTLTDLTLRLTQKKPNNTSDEEAEADDNDHRTINQILAQAVAKCPKLSSFELEHGNLLLQDSTTPYLQMLQTNYQLESVRLHCGVQNRLCLVQEAAFYTRLNQLGRGHLFQCPECSSCDATYLATLGILTKKGDLSAFFYFLSRRPSLFGGHLTRNRPCGLSSSSSTSTRHSRKVTGKRKRLYRAVKYNGVSYKS